MRYLTEGICSAFINYSHREVWEAVIDLGGADLVTKEFQGWWLRDYWELTKFQRVVARVRLLRRVGGIKKIGIQLRFNEFKARKQFLVGPPTLDPNQFLCFQINTYMGYDYSLLDVGIILKRMKCPIHITGGTAYWLGRNPSPEIRQIVIDFILENWPEFRRQYILEAFKYWD